MNYFNSCVKVEQVKALFKKLAMEHHPDRGGDLRTMQEINRQYQIALQSFDGVTSFDSEGTERTYRYNEATETELMEKISKLLALRLHNVDITMIGLYIWVTGETKAVKEAIKSVGGMRWHSKRLCWFYKPETLKNYRPRYSGKDLSELADQYGSRSFKPTRQERVN